MYFKPITITHLLFLLGFLSSMCMLLQGAFTTLVHTTNGVLVQIVFHYFNFWMKVASKDIATFVLFN
jgi:hypothetical protein